MVTAIKLSHDIEKAVGKVVNRESGLLSNLNHQLKTAEQYGVLIREIRAYAMNLLESYKQLKPIIEPSAKKGAFISKRFANSIIPQLDRVLNLIRAVLDRLDTKNKNHKKLRTFLQQMLLVKHNVEEAAKGKNADYNTTTLLASLFVVENKVKASLPGKGIREIKETSEGYAKFPQIQAICSAIEEEAQRSEKALVEEVIPDIRQVIQEIEDAQRKEAEVAQKITGMKVA